MSVLTYFLIAVILLVAAFLIAVAMQPADFRITRSTTISASPETVFALVNDFHEWENWSPWAKLDPNATAEFSGPAAGEGAHFHWSGNKEVGEGAMTIVESRRPELIEIRLEFLKPFKATNTAEFTFRPRGHETDVTWCMFGKNNFMGKAFGMLVNCDKMIGAQFEKGLAAMKAIAEGRGTT
jgi:uncharacterized protein YndB with AHSA1/START domain